MAVSKFKKGNGEEIMIYIRCEPIPERGVYRLLEGVIIEGVHCPTAYEWNGASIPFFLWPIIGSPFDPRFMAPSLYHDRGYETGELPRSVLDKTFKKLLIGNKVPEETAEAMYAGVLVAGGPYYNKEGVA